MSWFYDKEKIIPKMTLLILNSSRTFPSLGLLQLTKACRKAETNIVCNYFDLVSDSQTMELLEARTEFSCPRSIYQLNLRLLRGGAIAITGKVIVNQLTTQVRIYT